MNRYIDIITSERLTYDQKVLRLAQAAENDGCPFPVPDEFRYFYEREALCDMNEGKAPYRPRYVLADFERFVRNGSSFLRLDPPDTLDDLIVDLEILYAHIPSVTGRPVFIGELDRLIDPFLDDLTDEEALTKICGFLTYLDRVIANGYCHANIGPRETRAGRLILSAEARLKNSVPNLTMKYDADVTPDNFAVRALMTALDCSNPAFANDAIHRETFEGGYGVCSCFNVLPLGGGGYCLSRIVLPRLADLASSEGHFMDELLPEAVGALLEYMDARVAFIVEKSNFFSSSFLVDEGLISPNRFVGMLGVAGMSECVSTLLSHGGDRRYGRDSEADDLAERIMAKISRLVSEHPAPFSPVAHGRYLLHAQGGLAQQQGVTPGVRIKVGDEPRVLFDHIRHSARFHRFFPTGVSDIFPVESTARENPEAILDLVKGAFSIGDKYLSFYSSDGDLVRITGYLAKRSEMGQFAKGSPVLHDTAHGAVDNYANNHLGERKVRF